MPLIISYVRKRKKTAKVLIIGRDTLSMLMQYLFIGDTVADKIVSEKGIDKEKAVTLIKEAMGDYEGSKYKTTVTK